MTFKEFNKWCNDRVCDGCWSIDTAILCVSIIDKFNKIRFRYRREQLWKKSDEKNIAEDIVNQINQKISMYLELN